MNFNKCERCGCFFVTNQNVCPKCKPKENFEMQQLKSYLSTHTASTVEDISISTGISEKNLDRFLKQDEFAQLMQTANLNNNIKMNL